MKITKLTIKNFRSIEDFNLECPSYYTAISGKNNSGKSNVLQALRVLFQQEQRFRFRDEELTYSRHFPIWKGKGTNESIRFSVEIQIDKTRDASVFKLAKEFFNLDAEIPEIVMSLSAEYQKDKDQADYQVSYNSNTLDSYKSRTMFKTIKSSGAFQFYNSTEPDNPFESQSHLIELFGELSKDDRDQLTRDRDKLSKTVSHFAKKHQKDLSDLLGRLEDKYVVGLSAPKLNLDFLPIDITLGDKKLDVSLNEWGSGTKNRTHILLTLFKVKKLSESSDENTKISPILVIEEPESFLHPSAQAEFGRLVQDLCEEFKVQVFVATHSPYFLSQQHPASNVLLCRKSEHGQLRQTERVDVGSENWMEPFAVNLGLANREFEPWRELFFSRTNRILLVEGDIDKQYFEMLRNAEHGGNALAFEGEIAPYEGTGNIKNGVLLKFIRSRYHRFFVTFDLDSEGDLASLFQGLGMERGKHFVPIGKSGGGRDKIEGLLPDGIRNAVYGANGALVQQAIGGSGDEAKSAKQRLKRLLFEEFKKEAVPGEEYFGEFYKLAKIINKAVS